MDAKELSGKISQQIDAMRLASLKKRKKDTGPEKKYASFNRRMLAATIDSLLFALGTPLFNFIAPIDHRVLQHVQIDAHDPLSGQHMLMQVFGDSNFVMSWANNLALQTVVFFGICAICWHFWAATPGKMLMRMKLVDAKTEGLVSDWQILVRLIGYIVSAIPFGLGFFWIAVDKRRQGWHDHMAGTVVIALPWLKAKSEPVIADPSDSPVPSAAE